MPSTYIISTGQYRGPDGSLLGVCYAGHPPYVNNVAAVTLKNLGPLPPGFYRIGPPHDLMQSVGPFAMALTPLPDAGGSFDWLHGRSAFFIHGDDVARPGYGSDGCIVPTHLPDGEVNGRQVRVNIDAVRQRDDVLQVIATPPSPPAVTEPQNVT